MGHGKPSESAMVSLIGEYGARLGVIEGRLARTWLLEAVFVGLALDVLTSGGDVGRKFFTETLRVDLPRAAEFCILALGLTVVQMRFGFLVGCFERLRHACDMLLGDVKARSQPLHRTEEFDCLFKTTSLLEPYYQSTLYTSGGRRHVTAFVTVVAAIAMAFNHAGVVYLLARAAPGWVGFTLAAGILWISALCYRQYFSSLRALHDQHVSGGSPATVVASLEARMRRARWFANLLLMLTAAFCVVFLICGWSP